ncbi:MAG: DUF2442 domain-containing protein [Oscillospiraceae bacterium]|nr:DUF2442 domain-containing protein [Oscillospiraceae bacterium]
MIFHKIKSVAPLPDMCLMVEFVEGGSKRYDMKLIMEEYPVFKDLKRNNLFKLARVDAGGYGITWNDYIDISCNELWENGLAQP